MEHKSGLTQLAPFKTFVVKWLKYKDDLVTAFMCFNSVSTKLFIYTAGENSNKSKIKLPILVRQNGLIKGHWGMIQVLSGIKKFHFCALFKAK